MTISKIFIYAPIYLFLLLNNSINLFGENIRTLKDTNNITSFDEIETLSFHEINLLHIDKLKGKKIKSLAFHQCFGNINDILSVIDKSSLKSLSINESIVLDTLLNLDGCSEFRIKVARNSGWFKFTNLNSCIGFSCEFNTMHLDLKDFNTDIEILNLVGFNPLFLENEDYISKFSKLKGLWLRFDYPIDVELNLENLTDLELLDLESFTSLPSSIITTSLENLWINKIYNLDTNYLNSIIGNNPLLTSLTISNCNLKSIPNNIFKLESLRLLNLSENKLNSLEYDFSKMKTLQTLFLDNNYISEFNYKLFELPEISQVNLEFNNLKRKIIPSGDRDIINQDGNPFDD
jgi:hypothetical protein